MKKKLKIKTFAYSKSNIMPLLYPMASSSENVNENETILNHLVSNPDYVNLLIGSAVKQSDITLAQFLLDHGAGVDSRATVIETGKTYQLLFLAIINNDVPMTTLLLGHGANIFATSQWDRMMNERITPIELSIRLFNIDVFRLIVKQYLINHEIDEPMLELGGNNLMSLVIRLYNVYENNQKSLQIIKCLLDHGANPNYRFDTTIYSVPGMTTMEYVKARTIVKILALFNDHLLDVTKGVHCDGS